MKSNTLPIIFWIVGLVVLVGVAVNNNKKVPQLISGCCQVGDFKCASGSTVDEEICKWELDGDWILNTICNIDTGKCE